MLDRAASIGLADPTVLRNTLRTQSRCMSIKAFRRVHDHPGFHPYRIILADVRIIPEYHPADVAFLHE